MLETVMAGTALLAALGSPAAVSAAETARLQAASRIVDAIRQEIPEDYWTRARCVAVIPDLKKAAFIVGGEYGRGVLSCRAGDDWSAPLFTQLAKGSWGFQAGVEQVDLVLLVMNDRGMEKMLESKVALGGEMSVAGGPVGRDARAMTDAQLKAQILSYSRTQGLFAGIDLTGGVLKPDNDDNEDLYGRKIQSREILIEKTVAPPPAAAVFMAALRRAPAGDVRN